MPNRFLGVEEAEEILGLSSKKKQRDTHPFFLGGKFPS